MHNDITPETISATVWGNAENHRTEQGMTMGQASLAGGATETWYSMALRAGTVSALVLARLSQAFGVAPAELLDVTAGMQAHEKLRAAKRERMQARRAKLQAELDALEEADDE